MRFSENRVTLGKGRVSSARRGENGEISFIMEGKGALLLRVVPAGARQPAFSGSPVVAAYADDCFVLDHGMLTRRGGFEYVAGG